MAISAEQSSDPVINFCQRMRELRPKGYLRSEAESILDRQDNPATSLLKEWSDTNNRFFQTKPDSLHADGNK